MQFFGRISASISHELKNAISIINESAGLLEDLTLLAQKNVPIDANRLLTTAKRIQHQVDRADGILKNMNWFGHSIDRPLVTADIHEVLSYLMALTRRITDMKGISVTCTDMAEPVAATTSPFFLLALLWHILEFAVGVMGDSKTVLLSAVKTQEAVTIHFNRLNALRPEQVTGFPSDSGAALAARIGADIALATGSIRLEFPVGSVF